ncbi:MAG: hypothetical protein IJP17_00725 [Clostridia bacterium]|nr:hypothetical protein [Clostridia bacterium]
MKKALFVLCTAIVILSLSACMKDGESLPRVTTPTDISSASDAFISNTDTVSSSADAEETLEQQMQGSPVMHTMMASEGWESGFTQIHRYGSDGYEINVLWCDCDISNVKLLPIDMDLESARICGVGEPVFELSELKAGEAIELDVYVPEIIPTHAISYTAGDTEYFFMICYNGRDGGISLVEEQ